MENIGGNSQLKVFQRSFKPQRLREPLVRVEAAPSQQIQVDFGVIRRGRDRFSYFVASLGFSRQIFVPFVIDERIETVLACVRRSFEAFYGLPRHDLSRRELSAARLPRRRFTCC